MWVLLVGPGTIVPLPGGGRCLHHRPRLRIHFRLVHRVIRGAFREARYPEHAGATLPNDGDVARRHRPRLGTAADLSVQPVPRPVQGAYGGHHRSHMDVRFELLLPRPVVAVRAV